MKTDDSDTEKVDEMNIIYNDADVDSDIDVKVNFPVWSCLKVSCVWPLIFEKVLCDFVLSI